MGEDNKLVEGALYFIPQDGAQAMKIANVCDFSFSDQKSDEEQARIALNLRKLQNTQFDVKLTDESAKRLRRFFRKDRRYMRRHKQQNKRRLQEGLCKSG